MPPRFVTVRGRREPVKKEIRLGGKLFPVLEDLGSSDRQIFRVVDAEAGPQLDYRALHVLPRSRETEQRIEIIRRLTQGNRNFPSVVLYVTERNQVSIVFEWVWGQNLAKLLERIRKGKAPRFSVFEGVKRMRSLAHAIGSYNSVTNLVHADVKPANVVVTERPHNFVLIDFGSAWPVERTTRRHEGDGVTRPYAAPELTEQNGAADFRADIFSHGVMLYELLTMKIPYGGFGGAAREFGSVPKLEPASALSPDRDRLSGSVWRRIDEFLASALSLDAGGRFLDRGSWLRAIDDIEIETRRGSRMDGWQETVVGFVTRIFGRKQL